jgi:hypothetical protein
MISIANVSGNINARGTKRSSIFRYSQVTLEGGDRGARRDVEVDDGVGNQISG